MLRLVTERGHDAFDGHELHASISLRVFRFLIRRSFRWPGDPDTNERWPNRAFRQLLLQSIFGPIAADHFGLALPFRLEGSAGGGVDFDDEGRDGELHLLPIGRTIRSC